MSWLSSIFPTNSGTPVNAGPTQQSAQPTQQSAQQSQAPGPSATPPTPAVPPGPTASLDNFTALWQNPTTSDGKSVAPAADPLKQPLFQFDAAKITETANKMDFAGSINPELVGKALGGDAAAFADVLNQAVRNAVVGMTMQNGQMVNQALLANNERITTSLPSHINKARLMDTPDDNPAFSHPNAQPLVQSLKQMAFAKDPSASPDAINKQVSDYLKGFATAVLESDPAKQAANRTAAAKEPNWLAYGGLE